MSQEPHDLVASYALDALEEDERASFERHLAECERCSAQLAELQGSVGALAYAAEGPSPPAALRGKILDAARADRGAEVMFRRRSWALPAVAAIAAAAAMVAIGLGIWATSLSRSLDNERDAKAAYDRAARLLAAKATATPLSGADGSLKFSRGALKAIFDYSGGIPRVVNIVCDNALLLGFVQETKKISEDLVREVIRDLGGEKVIFEVYAGKVIETRGALARIAKAETPEKFLFVAGGPEQPGFPKQQP